MVVKAFGIDRFAATARLVLSVIVSGLGSGFRSPISRQVKMNIRHKLCVILHERTKAFYTFAGKFEEPDLLNQYD